MTTLPSAPVLDLEKETVYNLLKDAYIATVRDRGVKIDFDKATSNHLRQAANWLTNPDIKRSLLLYGGVGSGKTTLCYAIRLLIKNLKKSAEYYDTMKFSDADNYQKYKKFLLINTPDIISAANVVQLAISRGSIEDLTVGNGILVIDDLGCEPGRVNNYGTVITPIVDLICRRYSRNQRTIITTNLNPDSIERYYGLRVRDRIEEQYGKISFNNNSYRK